MMYHRSSLLALVLSTTLVVVALTSPATSAVPEQLHYQGVLQNSAGEPIHCPDLAACPDGLPDLTFRLYDQAEDGAAIWEETHEGVSVHHGHFQVVLGATSPVGVELLQGSTYLGVEVETAGEMSPRQAVVSTPYALRAQAADNLGGLPASDYVTTAVLPEVCVTPEDLPGLLAELEPGELPGDGDTLATLSCLPGAVALWNGAFWDCGHDLTPDSLTIAGTDTQLKDGSLDLGPGLNDELDAAMVNTLTGGGDADALHTHAGLGGGGVCYTVWGENTCAEGFVTAYKGRRGSTYQKYHDVNAPVPATSAYEIAVCLHENIVPAEPAEGQWSASKPNIPSYMLNTYIHTQFDDGTGAWTMGLLIPCAICCK
jgi:hypothetical protein